MIELYPPQKAAVEKLVEALRRLRVAGNWSVTGTGKTLVGLTVAKNLDLQPLVVAPLAAHGTWAAWSRDLGVPVVGIANPERLKTGKLPWVTSTGKGKAMQFRWNLKTGGNGHVVLWDEIHRGMLGQDSQTGRMAAMLRPQGIPVLHEGGRGRVHFTRRNDMNDKKKPKAAWTDEPTPLTEKAIKHGKEKRKENKS